MANITTGTPLFYDTTAGSSTSNVRMIYGILWVSDDGINKDIATDDDLNINDGNGNTFIGKRAKSAGDGLEFTLPYPIKPAGSVIEVTVMDGGVLYVFV